MRGASRVATKKQTGSRCQKVGARAEADSDEG